MGETDHTTFRVEFLTGETVEMSFDADDTRSLRSLLDRATTILGCPDCGDLAPVTGGIPTREMPLCPRCEEPLRGVTEVHRLEDADE